MLYSLYEKFGLVLDIGVSLTACLGIITFVFSKTEERKRNRQHRSWDHFNIYTELVLSKVLERRDSYIAFALDWLLKHTDENNALRFKGGEVNGFITNVELTLSYLDIYLAGAFSDFKSGEEAVTKRAEEYVKIYSEFWSKLQIWNRELIEFVGSETPDRNEGRELFLRPARFITDLHRDMLLNTGYIG